MELVRRLDHGEGRAGDLGDRLTADAQERGHHTVRCDHVDLHVVAVLGDVPALGDDHRHRIADELHLTLGQGRPGSVRHVLPGDGVPCLVHARVDIGRGEHRVDAWQGERRGGVDALDGGAGEGAAHETGVQHAGPLHVVDEGALAGEQAGVLDPGDTRSCVAGGHGSRH